MAVTESLLGATELKTLLRQASERIVEGLWRRIGQLLDRFTPDERANFLNAANEGKT